MNYAITTVTILSGGTASAEVDLDTFNAVKYVRRVLIQSPSTLPESVTMQVSVDGTNFATLQSGAADITFPAAKATQINGFMVQKFKLVAGGAVAADRVFQVSIAAE